MDQDPDKGASLSAIRRQSVRSRWSREPQSTVVPAPRVEAASPAPAPSPKKQRKPLPAAVKENLMPARDAIPFTKIVEAYHEAMPNNPRVRVMSDKTRGNVRSRWGEDKDRQRLEWWVDYFKYCNTCPLLVGKVPRQDAAPWIATFQWLVLPTNMEKVINGNYQ